MRVTAFEVLAGTLVADAGRIKADKQSTTASNKDILFFKGIPSFFNILLMEMVWYRTAIRSEYLHHIRCDSYVSHLRIQRLQCQ